LVLSRSIATCNLAIWQLNLNEKTWKNLVQVCY
jgi:hypothetical protein